MSFVDTVESPSPVLRARRILILGSPGSGKSTLSRRLGAVVGVDPIDLDMIAEVAYRSGQPRPIAPLIAAAERIAGEREWIVEGVFTAWTQLLVRTATDVVILRTSLALCLWRVIRRHFQKGIRNPHGGLRRLVAFCMEIIDYHRNQDEQPHWPDNPDRTTLAATIRFAEVGDRVAVLSNAREVQRFVDSMRSQLGH